MILKIKQLTLTEMKTQPGLQLAHQLKLIVQIALTIRSIPIVGKIKVQHAKRRTDIEPQS